MTNRRYKEYLWACQTVFVAAGHSGTGVGRSGTWRDITGPSGTRSAAAPSSTGLTSVAIDRLVRVLVAVRHRPQSRQFDTSPSPLSPSLPSCHPPGTQKDAGGLGEGGRGTGIRSGQVRPGRSLSRTKIDSHSVQLRTIRTNRLFPFFRKWWLYSIQRISYIFLSS